MSISARLFTNKVSVRRDSTASIKQLRHVMLLSMAKPRLLDDDTLRMSLIGYEIERPRITEKIAEVQQAMGVRNGASTSVAGAPPTKRRTMSASARRRIAAAQKA